MRAMQRMQFDQINNAKDTETELKNTNETINTHLYILTAIFQVNLY